MSIHSSRNTQTLTLLGRQLRRQDFVIEEMQLIASSDSKYRINTEKTHMVLTFLGANFDPIQPLDGSSPNLTRNLRYRQFRPNLEPGALTTTRSGNP